MSDNTENLMTTEHPEWMGFFLDMIGDLDVREVENGKVLFDCDGTFDKAYRSLKEHKGIDIPETLEYFEHNHANCDCEILFNVPAGKETTTHEAEKAIQEG